MDIKTIKNIAVVNSREVVITDGQSALDFMMSVSYTTECNCITLNKSALCEDFFKLSTGIAGDVLQKFVNYNLKFAIIGDFSEYTSKSFKDFVYENNKGNHILFLADENEAIAHFSDKE